MAEPEVEAAWRAEFERSGAKELRDALNGDGFTNELKKQAAFRWLGDEAEAQRLQQDQTYHYVRWTFLVVIGAVIAGRRYCVERRGKLDQMIRLISAFGT
jgi:hypothetical protein